MSLDRSLQSKRLEASNAVGPVSSRRAWWGFWGALALVSAALDFHFHLGAAGAPKTDPMLQYAYLDPGAGSFVIQALVAMLAGIAVTTKVYWHKIMGFFGFYTPSDEDDDDSDDARHED